MLGDSGIVSKNYHLDMLPKDREPQGLPWPDLTGPALAPWDWACRVVQTLRVTEATALEHLQQLKMGSEAVRMNTQSLL